MAHDRLHESARAGAGMVATPHRHATEAGRAVLEEGGNAVEAALAAAATLAVVCPHLSQLGGDGVWLIRDPAGRVACIDAAGPAGAGATPAFYRERGHDEIPSRGALAALTVPGQVGGWRLAQEAAHAYGGKMPMRRLLESAIEQARAGITVSPAQHRASLATHAALGEIPGFRDAFLEPDGKVPAVGTVTPCERLADTLAQLAGAGLDDFYRGDVGREIAADLARAGSPVTRADLAAYRAATRSPLTLKLPEMTLWSAPPPAQGLATLMTLALFARLGVARPEGFAHVHGLVEATKRAFHARDLLVTERDLLARDPADFLAPQALAREAAAIDPRRAAPSKHRVAPGGAVWFGAADRSGLMVSCVQSLGAVFGAGLVLPATGVLMHARGGAFSLNPRATGAGATTSPLAPGRRPPHTPAPGLAELPDGRVIAYGATGGDGQPQAEAAVMSRYALFGGPLGEAIAAPRWRLGGGTRPGTAGLDLEEGLDGAVAEQLASAGHEVEIAAAPFADEMGHAGAVVLHPGRGGLEGAHDPRAEGAAGGV
ncbi:gamma-glutamyltransferase [Ancylobacter dichloromethanicus]|uniref:Gamma-glutamyltransferase n=1 Tax=Ancylobacter dichloromethanicus TaxID=518825 RepID=A0A9W6J709_9HYPH|nr:gamma-glutamyltransferase [Ancylobacter dichloromethanicus]MBS7552552.1 gamma-glutamyltransferase [Ancylobacter dichloromethanicus]GLK71912.1 gamma-glutamyltransferase [Ancylobacter dichloromethanicus]